MKSTIAITCYDLDADLLPRLLEDIDKQTLPFNDIIISHSGGGLNYDGPAKVATSRKRVNQAIARNRAVDLCETELITFFDVDDIPHPDMGKVISESFRINKRLDLLLHDYYGPTEFLEFKTAPRIGTWNLYKIENKDPVTTCLLCPVEEGKIHHSHITVKTSLAKKIRFNESNLYYRKEDSLFCQNCFDMSASLAWIDVKLVYYS